MSTTLIELYDERPLENVLACQMLDPVRVVFICPEEVKASKRRTSAIRNYLKRKGWEKEIRFVAADMFSAKDVKRALTEVCEKYSPCVLDITGGTDAALFASGVLSCEMGTPAFTYSRKNNAYFSIKDAPFGERLDCDVALSVEDCFIMAGGSVRQGRMDDGRSLLPVAEGVQVLHPHVGIPAAELLETAVVEGNEVHRDRLVPFIPEPVLLGFFGLFGQRIEDRPLPAQYAVVDDAHVLGIVGVRIGGPAGIEHVEVAFGG